MLDVFLIWGVSLTHPALTSFLCGGFVLHIPCCLDFYAGSFSDTSRAGFFVFIWGFCVAHPVLVSFSIGGVSLTHPGLASFFFFFFFWGVSLQHPVLAALLSG